MRRQNKVDKHEKREATNKWCAREKKVISWAQSDKLAIQPSGSAINGLMDTQVVNGGTVAVRTGVATV